MFDVRIPFGADAVDGRILTHVLSLPAYRNFICCIYFR